MEDASNLNKVIEREGLNKKPFFIKFKYVYILLAVLFPFIASKIDYTNHESLLIGLGDLFVFILIIFGVVFLSKETPNKIKHKELLLDALYVIIGTLIIIALFYYLNLY